MLEHELRTLLEGTADAAFIVDAHGTTRSWNAAAEKLFGIDAHDAVGRPCFGLVAGESSMGTPICTQDCQVLRSVAAGQKIPNFDVAVRTRTGGKRWVNVSILQIYDTRSRSRLAIHFMRDIDARKKSEDLARKLVDTAKELVATADAPSPAEPVPALTEQEQKLLRGLATGRTAAEVAADLGIQQRTLRNHLYHINRKLQTRNRLQAVIYAQRHGLI